MNYGKIEYKEKIIISADYKAYSKKPDSRQIAAINNRIGTNIVECSLEEFADAVGNKGHTFTGAIFKQGMLEGNDKSNRKAKYFHCQQVFALDFDNNITVDEVFDRCKYLGLDIAFAYETFSSVNLNKFRVVFIHNVLVYSQKVASVIIQSLLKVFSRS
jgi:hypothetical protein